MRVPGFREAVNARQQKKEEMRSAKIGEYLKIAIETAEKKNKPGATTQLTKPRLPPLWSRQQFDRWRIEVENCLITTSQWMRKSILTCLKV